MAITSFHDSARLMSGLVLLVFCGCGGSSGPPLAKVSGQVLFQGKPVTVGEVSFVSEEGFGASSSISEQGAYSLRSQYGHGIPVGTYQVTVNPPTTTVDESAGPNAQSTQALHPEIPKKYRDFSTSGLMFTVEKGSQTVDLNLSP